MANSTRLSAGSRQPEPDVLERPHQRPTAQPGASRRRAAVVFALLGPHLKRDHPCYKTGMGTDDGSPIPGVRVSPKAKTGPTASIAITAVIGLLVPSGCTSAMVHPAKGWKKSTRANTSRSSTAPNSATTSPRNGWIGRMRSTGPRSLPRSPSLGARGCLYRQPAPSGWVDTVRKRHPRPVGACPRRLTARLVKTA